MPLCLINTSVFSASRVDWFVYSGEAIFLPSAGAQKSRRVDGKEGFGISHLEVGTITETDLVAVN